MSTREKAYRIIDRLTDEQLLGFIALFGAAVNDNGGQKERDAAFENLQRLRKNVQDFDEKKALEEYREERYI